MNEELRQFQPQVMTVLGGLLQYLRGYQAVPEWAYHLAAVALAIVGHVLFNSVLESEWRETAIRFVVGVSATLPSVWGGTFMASKAASAGASFIPVTNSKP